MLGRCRGSTTAPGRGSGLATLTSSTSSSALDARRGISAPCLSQMTLEINTHTARAGRGRLCPAQEPSAGLEQTKVQLPRGGGCRATLGCTGCTRSTPGCCSVRDGSRALLHTAPVPETAKPEGKSLPQATQIQAQEQAGPAGSPGWGSSCWSPGHTEHPSSPHPEWLRVLSLRQGNKALLQMTTNSAI